jgi:hypothetical protein
MFVKISNPVICTWRQGRTLSNLCSMVLRSKGETATAPAHPQSTPVRVTHFNNHSNFRWTIYNFDGKMSAFFIPPHATMAIGWGTTRAATISGDLPKGAFRQQFSVQQLDSRVVFQVEGSSGLVTLNKPSNGDVTTCAGGC